MSEAAREYRVAQLLRKQLEYFFSIGNLRKGVSLRTQMSAGGFVDLAALSRFGPIAALAADAAELINATRTQLGRCAMRGRNAHMQRPQRGAEPRT